MTNVQLARTSNALRLDAIKVARVEDILYRTSGFVTRGTLHITAHHLIFIYNTAAEEAALETEIWIPYPHMSLVTKLPPSLQGESPLSFQCRTFKMFSFVFDKEQDASDVFESIRELTVASSVFQLYAFFYVPNPPLLASNGWSLYSFREEFARMGVGTRSKAWRFSDINKDYSFSPTYPSRLVVPTRISDVTLQYAAKYRSKARIPALVYLHWANFGSITRASQPLVGLTNNRSVQDEKLVEAIFQSHHSPETRVSPGQIYGATSTNLIIDARGATAAVANHAKGGGTENMDYYKDCRRVYLGIENIHTMRESLNKVVEALREADAMAASIGPENANYIPDMPFLDRHALRRSGWLRHVSTLLEGTLLMVRNIHVNYSHVFVHCSDGWDRTAQLSSLAQICLDPYYRTLRGFQVLIEKDWISFGFRFLDRCGHLSSEKFFITSSVDPSATGGAEAAQAFLVSVQNKFSGQHHLKETSPVFHQFLEALRQIQRQYPERFEYNGRFLEQIHYHLYSCQFGSFLFNCERELKYSQSGPAAWERTVSVWDFLNSPPEIELNRNPFYDPSLDDPARREPKADMGVLFPNPKDVRFWFELYGRGDEEMNGAQIGASQDTAASEPIDATREGEIMASVSDPSPTPVSSSTSLAQPSLSPEFAAKSLSTSRSKSPEQPVFSASLESSLSSNVHHSPTSHERVGSPHLQSTRATPSRNQEQSFSSPSRGRGKPSDIFSSASMKSVWGKLSSNASAAYSAVQGAYDGVAKEIKDISISLGSEQELNRNRDFEGEEEGRLRSYDDSKLNQVFSSEQPAASNWSPSSLSRSSSFQPNMPSRLFDNPWNTARDTGSTRQNRQHADNIFGPSVWNDRHPSISNGVTDPSSINEGGVLSPASPQSLRSSTIQGQGPIVQAVSQAQNSGLRDDTQSVRVDKPQRDVREGDSAAAANQSDPLGVGLIK